jgi:hypothetical protein
VAHSRGDGALIGSGRCTTVTTHSFGAVTQAFELVVTKVKKKR